MYFNFICTHLGQRLLYVDSFVNDQPEDGLQRPKHIGGASQNNT
jgi:hypothetical protein